MDDKAIEEIAKQLGVGANYLAEHLVDFGPQWGMFKAIQNLAGVLLMGIILAVIAFVLWKALKAEGDEAFGCDKLLVVVTLTVFGLVALVTFGCFAVDAITHLAVPQVAMINDMLEMVQQ